MAVGRASSEMEESKSHSYFQEEQEERSGELQVIQLYLSPWEGDDMNPPASRFQLYQGKKVTRSSNLDWQTW